MQRFIRALVVLLGVGWLFVRVSVLRTSLAVFTDSLAHAFQWIGVTDPGFAWLLLGVGGGGIAGAIIGMQRAGRSVSGRQVRGTAAVVAGAMLVAGSYPPSGIATRAERPSHPRAMTPGVHLATERVSLHARPDAASNVTGTLPPRTRLTVMQTSTDGDWAYVETAERDWRHGWVRRAVLSDDTVATPRAREAGTPERVPPALPAQPTYAPGGEVQREPDASSAPAAPPRAPDSAAPNANPGAGLPPTTRGGRPARAAAGDAPAEMVDPAVIADVQARLGEARGGARTGDYAAALRALAAADESVTLAAVRYGETAWITALRRDAATARGTVRATCQSSVALANRRGAPPPRCE